MLIEFRIANYRSYAAEKRFSMVAGSGTELPDNTFKAQGFERYPLLRSAAIYGANASGKSNLIRAAWFLKSLIVLSAEISQSEDLIPVEPVLLDRILATKPSRLEITFLLDGIRHQYGLLVSPQLVHEEWLTVYPKRKPQEWFHRRADAQGKTSWSFSRTHLRGDKVQLADRTKDNTLFLPVAAQWNHAQLQPIYRWFRDRYEVLDSMSRSFLRTHRLLLTSPAFREWASGVLRAADTGISRVLMRERGSDEEIEYREVMYWRPKGLKGEGFLPDDGVVLGAPDARADRQAEVRVIHGRLVDNMEAEWDLGHESDGTQMMLHLLGPVYKSLQRGGVLFVDEVDTSLHPHLTRQLVRLFHDPESNPKGAQLIFTTHDTSLLDPTLFRRDQIWFTAKDASGATDLYSLDDYKEYKPRKDEALQKGYLAGRYGAVPVLERFESAVSAKKPDKIAGDG
jgi:hypothetical protein